MESPFRKRLFKATREDFRTFWSGHRWLVTFAMLLSPAVPQIIRHGWRSMVDWNETLANGFIGIVISLVGTFLVAMWRGARTMDAGLHAEIQQHLDTKKTMEARLATPKVPQLEQSRRDLVQEKLKQFSPEGIEAIRYALRHGEVDAIRLTLQAIPGADYSVQLKLEEAVVQAYDSEIFKTGGFVPGGRLTRVNPDLRDALSFHLLPHE